MKGIVRPPMSVLRASAQRSSVNRIAPAPTCFTHELNEAAPYYLERAVQDRHDGMLRRGARVVLLRRERGDWCRVADRQGKYVLVRCKSLQAL